MPEGLVRDSGYLGERAEFAGASRADREPGEMRFAGVEVWKETAEQQAERQALRFPLSRCHLVAEGKATGRISLPKCAFATSHAISYVFARRSGRSHIACNDTSSGAGIHPPRFFGSHTIRTASSVPDACSGVRREKVLPDRGCHERNPRRAACTESSSSFPCGRRSAARQAD